MAVQLGDKIAQIGSGTYKLVDAHDINVHQATDGTGDGIMATTDLLICDTDAAGAVKKILISQLPFLDEQTIGVADDNLLEVDDADGLAVNDYTKVTANGLVGRTYANVLTDLSLDSELTNLVTAEIQQLQNIGATTISANQWAALGGIAETLTATELNTLDGVNATLTAVELNYLDLTTLGTAQASKALTIAAGSTWTVAGMTCADLGIVTTVDINGGTIDGVTIGGAVAPTVTDLGSVATCDINGGTIDGITSLTVANSVDIGNFTLTANGLTIDGTFTDGAMSIASGALSGVTTIGCGAITSTGLLGVTVAGNTAILQNTTDAASNQVAQFKSGNRATAANDDEGYFSFFCDNDAGDQIEVCRLTWIISDITNGVEEGELFIQLQDTGGALGSALLLSAVGQSTFYNNVGTTGSMLADGTLGVKDDTTAFYLQIDALANQYSANRILSIDLDDVARTLTIQGNATISDWFDQSVKVAASPTFDDLTLTGSLIIADAEYIGSASVPGAIQIQADGDILTSTDTRLGVRATAIAYPLYVPWVTGDAVATSLFGSANVDNDQVAILAYSHSSTGVSANSSSGNALTGHSASGTGLIATSDTSYAGEFTIYPASINTVETVAIFRRWRELAGETPADGIGGEIILKAINDATTDEDVAAIGWILTDASAGSEDSAFTISTRAAGAALAEQLRVTNTEVTLAGDLLVDGGDIGVTGDTDLLQLAADNLTVNGIIHCTGLRHVGDSDTAMLMEADKYIFTAGDVTMMWLEEEILAQDNVTINPLAVNLDFIVMGDTDTNLIRTDASVDRVGIGIAVPLSKLHIDQASDAAAIPVLKLDQADIDDTFIDFIGTSAADGTRSISSDTGVAGACFGKVRIEINGVTKWVRVYDDST